MSQQEYDAHLRSWERAQSVSDGGGTTHTARELEVQERREGQRLLHERCGGGKRVVRKKLPA